MDENKSEQYTFAPEEKQMLEILATFEEDLQQRLQESKGEIERVKYYEKFQMSGIDFNNIFITTEKDVDGNISYHMYCGDSSNEILLIDSEGNIKVIPELQGFLNDIDLDTIMEENEKEPGKLKGISEKTKDEDVEKLIKNKEKSGEDKQKRETEEEKGQTEIEEDLDEQGEDLQIGKFRKINDKNVLQRMPQLFEGCEDSAIAYSNKLHRFVMLSKINGKWQKNNNVEPAKTTYKSIISIDEKGEQIERKVPHGLMKTNDPKQEIAVTIGQYGEIDIETIKVMPCQERIARQVRLQGEGIAKEENYETRKSFETKGREYEHDIAHQVNEIEEEQRENGIIDYTITEEDYIPNTQITWGELSESTGESIVNLLERFNREMEKGETTEEKVVETIEADYGNISHEHNRNSRA